MDSTFLEIRQNQKHVMEMLKHIHDEMHEKMDTILLKLGAEEEELQELPEREERWFKQLAFQAAKIYGEEHDLARHYKEAYKLETGKDWGN